MSETLGQQSYHELKRRSRGPIRRYVKKITGLSRAQITRSRNQERTGPAKAIGRGLRFHSDNGSEYINGGVAGLLNKLLIEQCGVQEETVNAKGKTKRVSNDMRPRMARVQADTAAATEIQTAKRALFASLPLRRSA